LSDVEKTVGLIQDVLLPLDADTRYDLYFTDRRIAIVCMGHSERAEFGRTYSPLTFIAPTSTSIDRENQKRINRVILEEEVGKLSMDDKLRLSKKSCYYSYDEIEEVKLVLSKKPKFVILSKDCESKFAPTENQLKQLNDLLPSIEGLKNKLSEAGSWSVMHQTAECITCGCCGFRNDIGAFFCQCCGNKIDIFFPEPPMLICSVCQTKNRTPAAFCKNCGTPIQAGAGNR
jgi:hypothetical protein